MFALFNTVSKPMISTLLKAITIAAASIMLYVSPIHAQYPWSDQPKSQRTPGDYSSGSAADRFNSETRRNEQLESYRQESLRQERERQRQQAVPPSSSSTGPEHIYGSDGRMITCWPSFNNTKHCR